MIDFIDECAGCPKELGCLGDSCPNKHVPSLICDDCGNETDSLYEVEGSQYCAECALAHLTKVNTPDFE